MKYLLFFVIIFISVQVFSQTNIETFSFKKRMGITSIKSFGTKKPKPSLLKMELEKFPESKELFKKYRTQKQISAIGFITFAIPVFILARKADMQVFRSDRKRYYTAALLCEVPLFISGYLQFRSIKHLNASAKAYNSQKLKQVL